SLGEGRLTGERTEQETQRVRRLFSNYHGVIYFIKSFLWRSFAHSKTSATTFYLKVYVFFSDFWYFFER
ncbi:hypothetical protein LIR42_10120, partial [Faecalicatena fissicatena]|uniref:hypothetical protein n=2 Tax=Faecalicatena fissicatena TaxID=290055 RepID=UPI001D01121D